MKDPVPTFTYLISRLAEEHPNLAYLHLIEPWVAGNADQGVNPAEVVFPIAAVRVPVTDMRARQSNDCLGRIWLPRPLVTAGGYTRESAMRIADETGQLIAFGRAFISNVRATCLSRSVSLEMTSI